MSAFRFLMLSYFLLNSEKVIARAFFLIILTYFLSLTFVVFHDGLSNIYAYKNPFTVYHKCYLLLEWYYYHRELLTFWKCLQFFLLFFTVYFLQKCIWNIPWGLIIKFPFYGAFKVLRRRKKGDFRYLVDEITSRGDCPRSKMVIFEKCKVLKEVEGHLNTILGTISGYDPCLQYVPRDEVERMKNSSLSNIGHALEEFMDRSLTILRDDTIESESKDNKDDKE